MEKLIKYRCHGERRQHHCSLILFEAPEGQHIRTKCRGCKTLHEFFPDGSVKITTADGKTQTFPPKTA